MSGTFLGDSLGGGFFPAAAAALSGVTPPAATSEAVAAGGSVTGWTFSAFTDPDGRIASYSATLVTVTGSGSLSGTGLGPYSITGTADGDAYTVELDALDGDGAVLATAVHTVTIEGEGLAAPTYTTPSAGDYMIGGYHDFDGTDEYINFGNISALELDVNGTWTISAWLKRPGGTGTMTAFGNSIESTGVAGSTGWRINWTSALGIVFQDGAAYLNRYNVGQASNAWVHAMFVSNAGSLTIYKNGASVGQLQTASGTVSSNNYTGSEAAFIGGQSDIGFMWDGEIAEVAVWSSDQSANVAAIYNSRARHNLMDLATPPDLFYAPLTSYGDDPDPATTDGVFEAVAGNDGTGVNMETADAVIPAPTTVTSTLTKALDIATSVVTTTKVEDVLSGGASGTGSSFP